MTKTLAPLALAALLLPGLAAAHSALEASVPGPDETVTAPVAEIALNFRNAIRLTRIEVEGPDGVTELEAEEPMGTEFLLPAELDAGTYLLRWIGLGIDGHPMKGEFGFAVE
ncbi:MAG: copper resistance CopC family protein [Shimia sp.]